MRHWRAAAGTAEVVATPAVADLTAAEAARTEGAEASTEGAEASTEEAEAFTAAVRTAEAVPSEVLAEAHLVVRVAARSAAPEAAHRPTRG
jgi:hypothetical protein